MSSKLPMCIQPEVYQLILDRKYAQLLVDILGYIGGTPASTRRGLSNELRDVLLSVPGVSDKIPTDIDRERAEIRFL